MKKVLIATTNKDKFDAVSKIFSRTLFPKEEYVIERMTDEMNIPDEKETGNNVERARRKALLAYDALKNYGYDYIVGLDDAIRIKGVLEPNIKEYVKRILEDNYLADGEIYAFNRAYAIVSKNKKLYETAIDISYEYHALKNDFKLEDHTYPLSKVSYPIGYDKPICELNEDEEIAYYLEYVKEGLMSLKIEER